MIQAFGDGEAQHPFEQFLEQIMSNRIARKVLLLEYTAIALTALWARQVLSEGRLYVYSLAFVWYDFTFAYGICGILGYFNCDAHLALQSTTSAIVRDSFLVGFPCLVAEVYKKSGLELEAWVHAACAFFPVILAQSAIDRKKLRSPWRYLTAWNVASFLIINVINDNPLALTLAVGVSSIVASECMKPYIDLQGLLICSCNVLFGMTLSYTPFLASPIHAGSGFNSSSSYIDCASSL